MVLAGLDGLRIRALYFTQSQRLSLGQVGLEEATETGAGGPANTVENCFCSPEYTGASCEVRRLNSIQFALTIYSALSFKGIVHSKYKRDFVLFPAKNMGKLYIPTAFVLLEGWFDTLFQCCLAANSS